MKQETKARIRVVGRILFLVYLLALVYFLFFAEEYGRRNFFELDYRYNLVPFQEIRRFWIYREKVGFLAAFLNLAGNVIGFLPFGFIVPVMHKKMESFWKVSLLGFMFSLCVETIQLITKVGCFDVDDLILNTLGAMIGCGAFLICNKFRRWKYGRSIIIILSGSRRKAERKLSIWQVLRSFCFCWLRSYRLHSAETEAFFSEQRDCSHSFCRDTASMWE